MKKLLVSSAMASLFAGAAQAALLVGFHDFNHGTGADAGQVFTSGFSGTTIETGTDAGSRDIGGSSTGFAGGYSGAQTNNGYLRALTGALPIVQVNNLSAGSYSLSSLVFDVGSQSGGGTFSVDYRWGTAGSWTTISDPGGSPTGNLPQVGDNNTSSPNFLKVVLSLASIIPSFDSGETIQFRFVPSNNGRIDNIGLVGSLSAIPEPGSLLALSGLVGAGCFLRSRRRPLATAPLA